MWTASSPRKQPAKPLTGTPIPSGLAFGRLVEGTLGCAGAIDDVRISRGVREISAPTDTPLPKDAQTLGVWSFDDLVARPLPAVSSANVPETFTIPAAKTAELTRANGWPRMEDYPHLGALPRWPHVEPLLRAHGHRQIERRETRARVDVSLRRRQGEHPVQPDHRRRRDVRAHPRAGTLSPSTQLPGRNCGASTYRRRASGWRISPPGVVCSTGKAIPRIPHASSSGRATGSTRSIRKPAGSW